MLKLQLKFHTESVDCWEVFILYLAYLPVWNTSEDCSDSLTKVYLDINSFQDSALEEFNSEVELKEFMTTLDFPE